MNTGKELFSKIIINDKIIDIEALDADNGVYRLNDGSSKATVKFVLKGNVIPSGVFENNLQIKKVIIPPSITKIEKDAFKGNNNLTYVFIPTSVSEIGDDAFSYSMLTQDMIDQIRSINTYAYYIAEIEDGPTGTEDSPTGTEDSPTGTEEDYNLGYQAPIEKHDVEEFNESDLIEPIYD